MKKLSIFIIIGIFILLLIPSGGQAQAQGEISQQEIAEKLIRFHVIANSDSDEDQALKLKVRDEILKYITPKLQNSKSLNESREIIKNNDNKIKKIALDIIRKNGYNYNVTSTLGQFNFPVKEYGNIILPEGTYEAYRVVIGSGEGKNWWCVMFPPLCFVDLTKGEVAVKETEAEMKKVLTEDEFKLVDKEDQENKIVLKSKVLEYAKKVFSKK
ncbi:MAG: stage II sporulation protein R [Clostridiaceae bacterium]